MARSIPDWPRMMRRTTAAAYCDLTPTEFDREVAQGRLPAPVKLGSQGHWSRSGLDEALERISGERATDWRKGSRLYAQA